jgi:hypothetical protein
VSELVLGIDPALRNVGLCLLGRAEPSFYQIRSKPEVPVITAARAMKDELHVWLESEGASKANVRLVCMEKQLSTGGESSALMFHMQMVLLEILYPVWGTVNRLAMPLPVQLTSYMKRKHGVDITSAGTIVASFIAQVQWKGPRVSQHKVDAYYLARMGQDLLKGEWTYKRPSKELKLLEGEVFNGIDPASPG